MSIPFTEIAGQKLNSEQVAYLEGLFAGLKNRGLTFSDIKANPVGQSNGAAAGKEKLEALIFEERIKQELHPLDAYPLLLEHAAANKAPDKARQTEEEDAKTQAQAEAESRRRTAQQLVARINSSSERISENLSAGTTIEPLGPGGPAYANYAQVVKTYYDRAWIDPEEVSENAATVKVRVVIARDGAVVSDSIITRSGVSSLDKSVENALRRVQQLPPFPEGAKEAQRTFIINFNLKAKRLLG